MFVPSPSPAPKVDSFLPPNVAGLLLIVGLIALAIWVIDRKINGRDGGGW